MSNRHPWHDVIVDRNSIEDSFPAVIEVPMGSKNKYELDHATGLLRLDRVLYSAVHYPANYGFVPQTLCEDGDPLDVLVLGEAVAPLTIVSARGIGVIRMRDEKGIDDKIVAINLGDPAVAEYSRLADLPPHAIRQIRRFFQDYKVLEGKEVVVGEPLGCEDGVVLIRKALDRYRTKNHRA